MRDPEKEERELDQEAGCLAPVWATTSLYGAYGQFLKGTVYPYSQSAMPGAQPGEWRASWISASTCPLIQVPLCRAQPSQPFPAALVLSRLCL